MDLLVAAKVSSNMYDNNRALTITSRKNGSAGREWVRMSGSLGDGQRAATIQRTSTSAAKAAVVTLRGSMLLSSAYLRRLHSASVSGDHNNIHAAQVKEQDTVTVG